MSLSPKLTAGHGALHSAQPSSVAQSSWGSPPGQGQLWPQVTTTPGQDTAHPSLALWALKKQRTFIVL